ncbi:MAG: OmpA family protein [Saprospiraceae bacterium]|nr:OmpA family protein [Saprospiraceae bacterium]
MMKLIRFLCLLFFTPSLLNAQATWEIGIAGGATAYAGDVNAERFYDLDNKNLGYGLLVRRHFSPVIALRLNYLGGKISGDESHFSEPFWRKERAFQFDTDFHEASLLLEWDIFGQRRRNGWRFRKIFAPYVFAGAGYNFFTLHTDYNDAPELNPSVPADRILADKNKRQTSPTPVLHVGGGFKWDLGRYWLLGFELGLRPVFSDYIDGISQSGNPDQRDWYAFGGITLSHRIREVDTDRDWIPNHRDKCPLAPGFKAMKGCPDADGDRITDGEDDCPDQPGVPSAKGCPDADGDGTRDSFDLCPEAIGLLTQCGCPDRDGDTVPDPEDACPDSAGVVFLFGCPDGDQDGIADRDDKCPDQGGRILPNGCPDQDGDGVEDALDRCPAQHGLAQFQGCPDTDEDGIEDDLDKCPAVKGVLAFEGCPDTDNDGIQDSLDRCPLISGLEKFQGCPDTDGDGLEDALDKCPTVAGTEANKGCPELKKEVKKQIAKEVRNIQFETASDKLTAASVPVLEHLAEILQGYPNYKVNVSGHTDSQGPDKKNLALSDRRANRCVEKLVELGIEKERLTAKGFGERKPIASNKTAKGKAKNRRVEFELVRMY